VKIAKLRRFFAISAKNAETLSGSLVQDAYSELNFCSNRSHLIATSATITSVTMRSLFL